MKTNRFPFVLMLAACAGALVSCGNSASEAIAFETLKNECRYACSGDSTVDCFDVSYNLEFPKNANSEAVSTVRATLITDLFGEKYIDTKNSKLLDDYIADCKSEYNQIAADYEDFVAANFYVEKLNAVPLFQNESLLTYEATRYIFTGGAHGMSSTVCWVFDLETGHQLTEDDIFVPNISDRLTDLLRQTLRTDATSRDLPIDEFFMDQVLPNGNFAVTDEGIYYQYNPYDIAPYAFGGTRLLLNREMLKPLLRQSTAVYKLYFAD